MNLNTLTEKAVAEQLGGLLLENTKLKAMNLALQAEIASLRGKVVELNKVKAEGEGDGHAEEAAGAA